MTRPCAGFLTVMLLLLVLPFNVFAAVKEEVVEYEAAGLSMKGSIFYDDSFSGKRPGIIVVHEWWGLNDYVRKRAQMLAALGYTSFAIDMYGGGKTGAHPDEAGKFASTALADMDAAKQRFEKALQILNSHPLVDTAKIAAIGYCFGGGVVLSMARMGVNLSAVVSFHGNLAAKTRAVPGQVKAKILVMHGEADRFILPEHIAAIKNEMREAQVDFTFISYPGAKHGFTNPDADELANKFKIDIAYNPAADKASWQEMQKFFQRVFKSE